MPAKSYREEGFFEGLWNYLPSLVRGLSVVAFVIVAFNFTTGFLFAGSTESFDNFEKVNDSLLQREYNYQTGNAESSVTYVIFDDLQCPACRQFNPTKNEIIDLYSDRVNIVRKHNPLTDIHAQALSAARAAEAANMQGQFDEYTNQIFENQDSISPSLYREIAESLSLDLDTWESDKESREVRRRVQQDQDDLEEAYLGTSSITDRTKSPGVGAGTPTNVVLLDGEFYDWWTGGATTEQVSQILDNALAGVEREGIE